MRPSRKLPEVYLCREVIDFRKGINTLSVWVEQELSRDPFSGKLFVFINRSRDKIKILYWESNGFCLWQKRLEQSRFFWPKHLSKASVITLTGQQLNWLLDGFDLRHWKPHANLRFASSF